jgi:MFS family permease
MHATRPARPGGARAARPALASFLGVFSATLLCFLAIGAVLPILPRYVTGPIGAGDIAVGIVVGAFAITALVSRPLGGRLADVRGRKAVHTWGMLICALGGALLFVRLGVPGLLAARLVVGFGDGWVFTAGVTWIVDLAPPARRGQAIGIFGLAIWGGLTLGSVVGQGVFALGGYDAVWAFAVASPLLGVLVARTVAEGTAHVQPVEEELAAAEMGLPTAPGGPESPPAPAGRRRRWIPREAVRPGIALALANVGYGTMAGFVVLLLDQRGIGHGAATFTVFAASVVLSRLVVGTLPDRIGPRRSAFGAGIVQACGLALVGAAHTGAAAVAGAGVGGAGMSLVFPSLALIVVRRIGEEQRGAAMGAFTSFFDLGVGLGAPFAGLIASLGSGGHYPAAFYAAAALCALGACIGFASSRGLPAGRAYASA